MQKYNILELNEKLLPELQSIAEELGIKKVSSLKKEELVYRILDEQAISYAGIQAEKEKEKEAKKKQKTMLKNISMENLIMQMCLKTIKYFVGILRLEEVLIVLIRKM